MIMKAQVTSKEVNDEKERTLGTLRVLSASLLRLPFVRARHGSRLS